MVISLLHPSRGRPEKSHATAQEWVSKIGDGVEWQLLVSLDNDDSQLHRYTETYFPDEPKCSSPYHPFLSNVRLYFGQNSSVVQATNHAAKYAKGDILVYLSDDFKCPDNWGQLIIKEFEGPTGPRLIKVWDGLQPKGTPILTIPIMNRAMYERLGYFFHPEYRSMFCDEHLYWVSKKLGALKMSEHLLFQHEHPANAKAPNDETYKRSAANWDQGKKLFQLHKSQGFPV